MVAHSVVGASAAKRWLACPGSVALAEIAGGDPDLADETSEYAADGTFAHRVLEIALGDDVSPAEALERVLAETPRPVPDWLLPTVEDAHEYLSLIRDSTWAVWLEQRVTFAPEHNGFGTCDFAAIGDDTLHIADLKTGVGVPVKAEENEQLLCYAVGVWLHLQASEPMREFLAGIRYIRLHVVQPRLPGGITSWQIPVEHLTRWIGETLTPGLARTRAADAPLVTGEHCRFCPAISFCPKWQEAAVALASPPETVTPAHIAFVLANAGMIRKHLKEVEGIALKKALAGSPPEGYRVVPGKTARTWKAGAKEALEVLYGADAYEPGSLKSPAQIETLPCGKEVVSYHAYQPEGAPTLAPLSDKRGDWQRPNFAQMFNVTKEP